MEDIYDNLENFNDINVVGELRAENEELKKKLGHYAESMASLQKDFDNLSAELRKLETNYSSLLKSARAEIKRKTDMIKNLNIEKDMLVLKQFQDKPNFRPKFMNANKVTADENVKSTNNPNIVEDLKQSDEFRKSPSTATEKSNKSSSSENRTVAKNMGRENEIHQNDVFPNPKENYDDDRRQGASVTTRRLSTLQRQQFLKFSSDEEFEDMYSALEPKSTSKDTCVAETQRGQKRNREETQHAWGHKDIYGPNDKRLSYTEMSRDRFNRKRDKRFNQNERNINRDKYDLAHSSRTKHSPDRVRYGKRECGDDRFGQQYDRHIWAETAPLDRYPHKSHERRLPYSDRGRSNQNREGDRNKYSETYMGKHRLANPTQIHGEYGQPPMKRFRRDRNPRNVEDRRRDDRQSNEYHPSEIREAYRRSEVSVNDELVNSVYEDLDKPTPDSATSSVDGRITIACKDVIHDSEFERDESDKNDPRNIMKDNGKDNLRSKHREEKVKEVEKPPEVTNYRIPLRSHKSKESEMCKINISKADPNIFSDRSNRSGLSNKEIMDEDLSSASVCNKNCDDAKTLETSKYNTENASFESEMPKTGKNETEASASFECLLDQKLASIRNIVEGDLHLSDETNDGTQTQRKDDDLPDVKKKHKTKKKSRGDTSKDKISSRKTRSKIDKNKDVITKNKLSELFGDSSSLITPEDLEAVPAPAPTLLADTYAVVCEDAQDGIPQPDKENGVRTLAAKKEISGPNSLIICAQTDSLPLEDKIKTTDTKDSNSYAHHRKRRKSHMSSDVVKELKEISLSPTTEGVSTTYQSEKRRIIRMSSDAVKELKEISLSPTTESVSTTLQSDVAQSTLNKTTKEQYDRNKSENKTKDDVLLLKTIKSYECQDTPKEINLNNKTKGDGIATLSMPAVVSSEEPKEIHVNKVDNIQTPVISKINTFSAETKDKKTEICILETHTTPEAVETTDKHKTMFNSTATDKKTESEVAGTYSTIDVKTVASSMVTPTLLESKSPLSHEQIIGECDVTKLDKKKVVEKINNHAKSSRKSKSNQGKAPLFVGNSNESHVNKDHKVAEPNIVPLNSTTLSSNKENESTREALEGTTNNESLNTFDDTLVPIENTSVDKNKTEKEKLNMCVLPKEVHSNVKIDDTPNLEAVTEDPGLVNTLVISSGIQPSDVRILPESHCSSSSPKAPATLTHTVEMPSLNALSEIKPCVNTFNLLTNSVKTNENLLSKTEESDAPDVRIYCYRRRRRVVK